MLRAEKRIEPTIWREPLQCDLGLVLQTSGEDRQTESLAQPFEQSGLGEPLFALDQPIPGFSSIGADENVVEVVDDGVVRNIDAQIGGNLLRKRPVIVPAALVLIVLDQVALDALAREMFDSLHDRLAVGFGHFRQHAVHIENN